MIQIIPPAAIESAWLAGACDLVKALDRDKDGTTPKALLEHLKAGQWLLARCGDAWAALEIQEIPFGKVMHICAAYGPGECDEETTDQLKALAKAAGCVYLQCGAFGAAERLYRRLGFEPAYSIMRQTV